MLSVGCSAGRNMDDIVSETDSDGRVDLLIIDTCYFFMLVP